MEADEQTNNQNQNKKEGTVKSSFFFFAGFFLLAIAVDQLSKLLPQRIFNNYDFAFSLPLPVWLMYLIYGSVLAAMAYYCKKHYPQFSFLIRFAWTLIFAGAASNIGERILLGYVRDFIYLSLFGWTGVYNLADFYIIISILLLTLKVDNLKPKA